MSKIFIGCGSQRCSWLIEFVGDAGENVVSESKVNLTRALYWILIRHLDSINFIKIIGPNGNDRINFVWSSWDIRPPWKRSWSTRPSIHVTCFQHNFKAALFEIWIFRSLFMPVATSSLSCCPTSLASFSTSNPCTFLSSAAAAALFRNVSYVHGCPL